jgi:hypothetical protein
VSTSFEKLPEWKPWPESLARSAAAGLIGLLAFGAVLICWRRVEGGLSRPLELPGLVLVAVAVAALAAAGRAAWRYPLSGRAVGRRDWAPALTISAAVVGVGLAIGLPGTSSAGLALLWAILIAEESSAWLLDVRRRRKHAVRVQGSGFRVQDSQLPTPDVGHVCNVPTTQRHVANLPPDLQIPTPRDSDVLQQLTRSRAAGGGETLAGWLRVGFSAGQRSTSVHVAFCPPFARTPKVTLQQLDGPTARIKTVQLLPYGARFDIKLAAVSEAAETLLLQFSAHSEPQ